MGTLCTGGAGPVGWAGFLEGVGGMGSLWSENLIGNKVPGVKSWWCLDVASS